MSVDKVDNLKVKAALSAHAVLQLCDFEAVLISMSMDLKQQSAYILFYGR